MSPPVVGITGLAGLFLLLFMGVPIGYAMGLMGFVGFGVLLGFDSAMEMVARVPYANIAAYLFSIIPVFLLMGELLSISGLLRDAYRGAHTWLGRLPGGLGMATIVASAAIGACTGTSMAAIITMTRISLPEMLEYEYDPGISVGIIAAGSKLSTLIPPSLPLVVYGIVTEMSIGRLLIAGIIPGLLDTVVFMAVIYIVIKVRPLWGGVVPPGSSWRQKLVAFKDIWAIAVIFLVVMGGIWGGIFTPTEAGSIGVLAGIAFAVARKRLTRQNLMPTVQAAIRTTGFSYLLVIGAFIFIYFMSVSRLPFALCEFIGGLDLPPMLIMLGIFLLYIIMGCFLEAVCLMLLTVPILFPLVQFLGFDPIWFGIVVTVFTGLAGLTPPIGMHIFIMHGMRPDIPMSTMFRGVLPFALSSVALCVFLLFFPQIVLWLPNTMMGM